MTSTRDSTEGPGSEDENYVAGASSSRIDPSTPWIISETLNAQDITRNRRLKNSVQSTPWLDQWEFEHVGQSLAVSARGIPHTRKRRRPVFSDSVIDEPLASLHQALAKMSVWKIRMDHRIPHAIESSYQLAQVHAQPDDISNIEQLKLAYGCAILRCINGLADSLQQTRASAASVAVLCADLGIPSWLVDIRHEATHNQLPALSVLRLAASTLLEYFQQNFWQPRIMSVSLSQATMATPPPPATVTATTSTTTNGGDGEASIIYKPETLVQILLAYTQQQEKLLAKQKLKQKAAQARRVAKQEAAEDRKKNKKKKKATKNIVLRDSSDDDSDEEMYLDALVGSRSSSSNIGTSTNRFAALQETKRIKKKPKAAPATKEKEVQQAPRQPRELPAHHFAKQYIKQSYTVGLEVAYQTALLFMVWGGVGGLEKDGALMVSSKVLDDKDIDHFADEQKENIQYLRQMFSTLLVVLGREWPGFLQALLIHLVARVLALEEQLSVEEIKTALLYSWIRYLVSREFVSNFYDDLAKKTKSCNNKARAKAQQDERAPWEFLEKMCYPLNSLCDRLDGGKESSQQVANFFREVLKENRTPQYGVVLQDDIKDADGTVDGEAEGEPSGTRDQIIAEAEANSSDMAEGPPFRSRTAWVKCKTWEPCSLGSMPGHPCPG